MARPRKPEDRQRWPIGCARCRGHYALVATWPDGSICGYCYQAAVLAALEARLGTLNELMQATPIAILAETLGYSPQTLEAHARASASTYARYVATRLD